MTRPGLSPALSLLNAEWHDVQHHRVPPEWGATLPDAMGHGSLGDLLADVRCRADEVLGALLALELGGDHRAGRVVVQAMLPKLVLMAVRDAVADFDDYLAVLWIRIATYPLARRPRRIAANLALDTLKSVKAAHPHAARALPPPLPDPLGDALAVLDAGVRLGVIDPLTRRTLEVVYIGGRSSGEAAGVLGTSPDAVRWRCSRGVRALRAVADDLVDELAA